MSEIEPWPLDPILATLPAAARLARRFDVARLVADVETLRDREWFGPRVLSSDGVSRGVDIDWLKLPLRSIGGNPRRSDPGGPSLEEFADTPFLREVPYLAEVLAQIPAPLRCVRLQSLGQGATSPLHNDTKYCLPWGIVRLHVPVVTTPGAILRIDEQTHCWPAGELWYADFTRPHQIHNANPVVRIHLVIDCRPTRALLELFPAAFRRPDVLEHTLLAAPEVPLSPAERARQRCRFDMPATFPSFEEPDGAFLTAARSTRAVIDERGGQLVLFLDNRPAFGLVHVGGGEHRFAGWTSERTLAPQGDTVTLRTRVGARTRTLSLPARPLEDR